jgi:CPA2 family monovalent cation:H+ antiporter-2
MEHNTPLLSTLALALGMALVFGVLAARFKLPALVGYLLAGIVIGPYTPGFVADVTIARQLAEVGVMLLMFGVGLHFSLDDLLRVRRIALPGAILQIAVATGLGMAVASLWGWDLGAALVFGLALSVASTVVLLRALQARGALRTIGGRIAVGWLVVEDLAMVLVLVLLPPFAAWVTDASAGARPNLLWVLAITLVKVAAFVALMLALGRRVFPRILWLVARTNSRELFTLCVIAAAVSIAFGAAHLFGVSFALGAFIAGMVLRESEFSHRAAAESLPLQEAFAVLFFVSVGMLFDPMVPLSKPLHVLVVLGIIVIGKSIAAAVLVIMFRYRLGIAITVAASLAQIGEFSFILAGLGVDLGLLPAEGQSLILAGALLSIALNPLLFAAVEPVLVWLQHHSAVARQLEHVEDPLAELPASTDESYLSGQVVIVGYSRIGRAVSHALIDAGIPHVVADQRRELVEHLRSKGAAVVFGDAADPAVLVQAHIARASMLVIAVPGILSLQKIVATARTLNPRIEILVCAVNRQEVSMLENQIAGGRVFFAETEMAANMAGHVLKRFGREGGNSSAHDL